MKVLEFAEKNLRHGSADQPYPVPEGLVRKRDGKNEGVEYDKSAN